MLSEHSFGKLCSNEHFAERSLGDAGIGSPLCRVLSICVRHVRSNLSGIEVFPLQIFRFLSIYLDRLGLINYFELRMKYNLKESSCIFAFLCNDGSKCDKTLNTCEHVEFKGHSNKNSLSKVINYLQTRNHV